jgi:hypothetical protein
MEVLSLALYTGVVFLLNKEYPTDKKNQLLRLIWAFSLAGIWHTLQLGQIYAMLLVLIA